MGKNYVKLVKVSAFNFTMVFHANGKTVAALLFLSTSNTLSL